MTKNYFFNGARKGKPAIILRVSRNIDINVDAIAQIVGDKPLHIRLQCDIAHDTIELYYDLVSQELGAPQAVLQLVDGEITKAQLETALFHLDPVLPAASQKAYNGEMRVYNPVRRMLEKQEAREYLDPELEKLLLTLLACM